MDFDSTPEENTFNADAAFGEEQPIFGATESVQDDAFAEAAPQSGFVFVAQDTPAAESNTLSSAFAMPASTNDEPNALVEFNKQFRELCEQKDAKERDARAQRKASGKAALKAMVAERTAAVEGRKAGNRQDETARVADAEAAAQGESWNRVSTLIDVHAAPAAASGSSADGSKKSHKHEEGAPTGDAGRMKDVLIHLKNNPLAAGPI